MWILWQALPVKQKANKEEIEGNPYGLLLFILRNLSNFGLTVQSVAFRPFLPAKTKAEASKLRLSEGENSSVYFWLLFAGFCHFVLFSLRSADRARGNSSFSSMRYVISFCLSVYSVAKRFANVSIARAREANLSPATNEPPQSHRKSIHFFLQMCVAIRSALKFTHDE